jgi:mercuric ion transport protein
MKQNKEKASKNETWVVIGIMFACCLAPIVFIGMAGAWFSSLTGKEIVPFVFFVLTLAFIGFGYRKLYFPGNCCQEDQTSVSSAVKQKQRMIFWIASVLALMLWVLFW